MSGNSFRSAESSGDLKLIPNMSGLVVEARGLDVREVVESWIRCLRMSTVSEKWCRKSAPRIG